MPTYPAIAAAFQPGRPAFIPYFTLGYPDYPTSLAIIRACVANGADLVELGMPFSDPVADGATIQNSTHIALQKGMTTARCLQAVSDLRALGVTVPLFLFGYYNPVLQYGLDRFGADAAAAGANGFLIPDLPPSEGEPLETVCDRHQLGLTYLLAPTSTPERMELVGKKARGFTYLVSVTGITGARAALAADLPALIARVKAVVPTPVAVGFGISTPEQARQVGQWADGVIVGSKLIQVAQAALDSGDDPADAVGSYVRTLVKGLRG